MNINAISTGQNTSVNTTATVVFGAGPGQVATPGLLLQNLSAGGTITLPKINQVPPTAPGTPGTTPGIGDGYMFYIKNIAQQPTTILAASGDTTDVALMTNINDSVLLIADASNSKWRNFGGSGSVNQFVSSAVANTLATNTRYLLMTAANTVTIPSTFPNYQPFSVMNESVGSVTITPASGTVNTTVSFTLTTLKGCTLIFDGVNTHLVDN